MAWLNRGLEIAFFMDILTLILEWLIFESLDQLREKLRSVLEELNQDIIASLTGWNQILMSLSLAGL
ncbi:hypothetical protein AY600_00145 [Phormidium willei BDU 130791]|nr:hypothetical protein AY600_00145 [Phormidium willei BDU 130791]